jgi:hypothetical protein
MVDEVYSIFLQTCQGMSYPSYLEQRTLVACGLHIATYKQIASLRHFRRTQRYVVLELCEIVKCIVMDVPV